MVVLQLEMDQIDPSLMDTDHHHRQFQLQRTTTANDHQDAMDVQDGQGADSRHFGRLLDAIHIGSNDGSSSTSNAAHGEQWQHSDRPPHKQVPSFVFFVTSTSLILFVCYRDLTRGNDRTRTQENQPLSLNLGERFRSR